MQWTETDRANALTLMEPSMLEFITKIFVKSQVSGGKDLKEVLKKNIAALDDDEYGRLMKVVYLTSEENKHRLNLIKQIAQKPKEKADTAIAPR